MQPVMVVEQQPGQNGQTTTQVYYLNFAQTSPIPPHFTVCAPICCAFTFSNCEFKKCWGAKTTFQCCCFETDAYVCKWLEHDRVCCVCQQLSCELVNCTDAFKLYYQLFCFECICGCPLESAYIDTQLQVGRGSNHDGVPKEDEIMPCSSGWCSISSCFIKWPELIGCYEKAACLCCEAEGISCKPVCGGATVKPNLLCILSMRDCYILNSVATCCKGETQCCCNDTRFALPCDEEVPCLCMLLPCCTVCYNFQCGFYCCETLASIKAKQSPNYQAQTQQPQV